MFTLPLSCRTASLLIALMLGGCAMGPVDPVEKDTSGAYEGIWTGRVAAPTATRVSLPGNWYMRCDWQPFEFTLTVTDGMVYLGNLVDSTPISADGRFRFDVITAAAGMDQGVIGGNGKFIDVFQGSLKADVARGSYSRYVTSISTSGCATTIRFQRQAKPVMATRWPIA